jgi:hypothetical protein
MRRPLILLALIAPLIFALLPLISVAVAGDTGGQGHLVVVTQVSYPTSSDVSQKTTAAYHPATDDPLQNCLVTSNSAFVG